MKVIGKMSSGKTTFVSAFTNFLIKYINIRNIYLISPTSDQKGWDRIHGKIIASESTESIKDIKNALIICHQMQIQLKNNKVLTEMILNKRHKNISIIQCKQCTQNTDLVQKMNADYFVLLGTFTLGDYQYFTEKFLCSLLPELMHKLFKCMNENNNWFLWTDREEKLCLRLQKEVTPITNFEKHSFLIRFAKTI